MYKNLKLSVTLTKKKGKLESNSAREITRSGEIALIQSKTSAVALSATVCFDIKACERKKKNDRACKNLKWFNNREFWMIADFSDFY